MILNKLLFGTDPIISLVLWILMIFSLISWAIIFSKFSSYRKLNKKLSAILLSSKKTSNSEIISEISDVFSSDANIGGLNDEKTAFLFKEYLEKGMTALASIGSSAPFIGLFGTVWGIYFALIDISGSGSASIDVVAKPMGEALIATAVGLFAAIPAVIAFNFYKKQGSNIYKKFELILSK